MKTCYIYARTAVSSQKHTSGNDEDINHQVKLCRDYASQHKYEVLDIFKDSGKSGANLERNGVRKLLTACLTMKVNALIVFRLDRISRNAKDLFKIDKTLAEKRIELITVSGSSFSKNNMLTNVLTGLEKWKRERGINQ